MQETLDLSIIVGFKDWGLDRLLGVLESVNQSCAGISAEVIIADYGSENTSGYREQLESAGAVYTYVETDGVWSRSRALNAGLKLARGKYLITTDADMVFSPSTFPRILELMEGSPRTTYILQCRDLPEGITHEDIFSGTSSWEEIDSLSRLRPRWGMGGLIAFDRDAYEKLRGLDERMEIYGGEDIDLAKRLLRIGYKRVWINDPDVRMYHIWHDSSRDSAGETEVGRKAMATNRKIHMEDKTSIRNLTQWQGRPESAAPLVTVAMSTYNRAEYLEDCITSVLGQTFSDWEMIIVNDGSTDNTAEVLAGFDDPRITIIHQENRGLAASRNFITSLARGKYIAVHDDDDIMLPRRLEHCVEALVGGAQGSYGGWVDFDNGTGERTYHRGRKFSLEALLFSSGVYLHPTLMVEKGVLEAVPYNDTMRSGSDYNLAVRMAREGVELNHCGHYVLLRRQHPKQITNQDGTLQKVSSTVTGFYARSIMSPSTLAEARKGRGKKDWVRTDGQDEIDRSVVPFLPDHLVSRSALISWPDHNQIFDNNVQVDSVYETVVDDLSTGQCSSVRELSGINLAGAYSMFSSTEGRVPFDSSFKTALDSGETEKIFDDRPLSGGDVRQHLENVALQQVEDAGVGTYVLVFANERGNLDHLKEYSDVKTPLAVVESTGTMESLEMAALILRCRDFPSALEIVNECQSDETVGIVAYRIAVKESRR